MSEPEVRARRPITEPFTRLVGLGEDPKDPDRVPKIDEDLYPALEEGEEVIYEGDHPIDFAVYNIRRHRWDPVFAPKKDAELTITDRRVIMVSPQYKSDRALGSVYERRVVTAVLEHEEGKQVLCGHVRLSWLYRLLLGDPKGLVSPSRKIAIEIRSKDNLFRVNLKKFDPEVSEDVVDDLLRAIGKYRLAHQDEIPIGRLEGDQTDAEQRRADDLTVLTALSELTIEPEFISWGISFALPGWEAIKE
jgi:hypothetical protein